DVDGVGGYGRVLKGPAAAVAASAEDWSATGSWKIGQDKRGQDKPAPAWSFKDDRYGGDSRGNGTPLSTTPPQRDPSFYPQQQQKARTYRPVATAAAASPPIDAVATVPRSPHRSHPLFAGDNRSRASSSHAFRGLHDNDDDQETRALHLSPSVSRSL
ncbi:unnamed protein product, partial [Laminaria digitata]